MLWENFDNPNNLYQMVQEQITIALWEKIITRTIYMVPNGTGRQYEHHHLQPEF